MHSSLRQAEHRDNENWMHVQQPSLHKTPVNHYTLVIFHLSQKVDTHRGVFTVKWRQAPQLVKLPGPLAFCTMFASSASPFFLNFFKIFEWFFFLLYFHFLESLLNPWPPHSVEVYAREHAPGHSVFPMAMWRESLLSTSHCLHLNNSSLRKLPILESRWK